MSAVRFGSNAKANRETPLSASKRRSFMFLCREPFSLSRRGRPSCGPKGFKNGDVDYHEILRAMAVLAAREHLTGDDMQRRKEVERPI